MPLKGLLLAVELLVVWPASAHSGLVNRRGLAGPEDQDCPRGSLALERELADVGEPLEQSLLQAMSWKINATPDGRETSQALAGTPSPAAAAMPSNPMQDNVQHVGGAPTAQAVVQWPQPLARGDFHELVQAELVNIERRAAEELKADTREPAQSLLLQPWPDPLPSAATGGVAAPLSQGGVMVGRSALWRPGMPGAPWPSSASYPNQMQAGWHPQGPTEHPASMAQAAYQPNLTLLWQASDSVGVQERQPAKQTSVSEPILEVDRAAPEAYEDVVPSREASTAPALAVPLVAQRPFTQQEAAGMVPRTRGMAQFDDVRPSWNASSTFAGEQGAKELLIVDGGSGSRGPKSKVVLLLIETFGLALLGIDRCYLGNACLGILKGMSLAGFGIWAIVDWILIAQNAIELKEQIDVGGMHATFTPESLQSARPLALIFVVIGVLQVYAARNMPRKLASVSIAVLARRGAMEGVAAD